MAGHPKHYFSIDEYLALEKVSDARFEYWDGELVLMSGGKREHNQIADNVYHRLRLKLEGGPCRAFSAAQNIDTPALPPYRYPDASVACGKANFRSLDGIDLLTNPVLIVEVLSPSTESVDRRAKFDAYKAIPSFREYLLIRCDIRHAVHHIKQPDGSWVHQNYIEGDILLESIGGALSFAEIYEGVPEEI